MRKIKIRELPEKIRARAEFYMKIGSINAGHYDLAQSFMWFDTKEGKKFWELVSRRDWNGAYNERPELREEFYIKGSEASDDQRWEEFIEKVNYEREKAGKCRLVGKRRD